MIQIRRIDGALRLAFWMRSAFRFPCMTVPRRNFLVTLAYGAVALAAAPIASARSPRPVPRRSIIPAALTPLDNALALDLPDWRRHIAALASVPGVTAIMVNGASGHDNTLTRDDAAGSWGKRWPRRVRASRFWPRCAKRNLKLHSRPSRRTPRPRVPTRW